MLHLAVDVVVLRRKVMQPDRLPTRLTPGPSPNYDVSDRATLKGGFIDIGRKDDFPRSRSMCTPQ